MVVYGVDMSRTVTDGPTSEDWDLLVSFFPSNWQELAAETGARLGHLPKYDDDSAQTWLYGKLLVALLVEKVLRHARAVSPWGYNVAPATKPQPVA